MEIKTSDRFTPRSRKAWRQWLEKYHDTRQFVWLVFYKKNAGKSTLTYNEAVDEALCFGWIDSKALPLDETRYMQYFTRRKPAGVWSKINKEKVAALIEQGLMQEAGYRSIETAKQNGAWNILDDVEALVIPPDLEKAFKGKAKAKQFFLGLARTDKRNILQWLVLAKKPETRNKRIAEIVDAASMHQKPRPFL